MVCKKCKQEKEYIDFFHHCHDFNTSDEKTTQLCKDCIFKCTNDYIPLTFLKYLKELDIPFIWYEWFHLKKRYRHRRILGRYISKMKLHDFRQFKYKDSLFLNKSYLKYRVRAYKYRIKKIFLKIGQKNDISAC